MSSLVNAWAYIVCEEFNQLIVTFFVLYIYDLLIKTNLFEVSFIFFMIHCFLNKSSKTTS